jgi:hypothetical protein
MTNVHASFYLGVAAILAVYNCKTVQSTRDLRELAVRKFKKSVPASKLRDVNFNNNYISYKELLEEFKQIGCSVDRLFVLNRSFIYSLGHNEILQILTDLESHYLENIQHFIKLLCLFFCHIKTVEKAI